MPRRALPADHSAPYQDLRAKLASMAAMHHEMQAMVTSSITALVDSRKAMLRADSLVYSCLEPRPMTQPKPPLSPTPLHKRAKPPSDGAALATAVPAQVCPACVRTDTRDLEATSKIAVVNYHGCSRCGHLWTTSKNTGEFVRHITPLMTVPGAPL